jgi:hypothetical protein
MQNQAAKGKLHFFEKKIKSLKSRDIVPFISIDVFCGGVEV